METIETIKKLEKEGVWEFINVFYNIFESKDSFFKDDKILGPYKYRNYVIKMIRNKYNPEEFYYYEKILNNMFWKLKKNLKPFVETDKTRYTIYKKKQEIDSKLVDRSYSLSFNQYREETQKYYCLHRTSHLDNLCMNIITNKEDYELYNKKPELIKKYDFEKILIFYYDLNYPFPNVNPMFKNKNNKKLWLKKIKSMYYFGDNIDDNKW